jgi:antitoxin ParD1/3/4
MPTRNINLTPELDQFVDAKIQTGQYANASEVLRAGLRALEQDDKEDQAKLQALRHAVQAGIDSGFAKGDVIGRMRSRIRRRAEANGKLSA